MRYMLPLYYAPGTGPAADSLMKRPPRFDAGFPLGIVAEAAPSGSQCPSRQYRPSLLARDPEAGRIT
jgi:hypothetical protein